MLNQLWWDNIPEETKTRFNDDLGVSSKEELEAFIARYVRSRLREKKIRRQRKLMEAEADDVVLTRTR